MSQTNLPLPTATNIPLLGVRSSLNTGWGYLRHELLYITWAIMEAALLTPFALALMLWAGAWSPSLLMTWVVLLILLPVNLTRLMSLFKLPLAMQRRLLLTTAVFLILFTIRTTIYRPDGLFDFSWLSGMFETLTASNDDNNLWGRDLGLMTLIIVSWWRGFLLITRHPSIDLVGLYVRRGGLFIAPLVIWAATRINLNSLPFVAIFFLAGLTAVSLVRVEALERDEDHTAMAITPRSFSIITAISALTVGIPSSIAFALTQREGLIDSLLSPIWLSVRFTTATVFTIIRIYILRPLIPYFDAFVQWLARLLTPAATAFEQEAPTGTTDAQTNMEEFLREAQQREVIDGFLNQQTIILIGLIILLFLAMRYFGALYRQYQAGTIGQQVETTKTATQRKPRPGLGDRLRRQWQNLRGWRTAASIRRIYQQMCNAAEDVGFPRHKTETPYEYLPTLYQLWPDNHADARLITNAYIQIRYGELPESRQELQHIIDTWETLRNTPIRPPETTDN